MQHIFLGGRPEVCLPLTLSLDPGEGAGPALATPLCAWLGLRLMGEKVTDWDGIEISQSLCVGLVR